MTKSAFADATFVLVADAAASPGVMGGEGNAAVVVGGLQVTQVDVPGDDGGESRPPTKLWYATGVAVRPDSRRGGIGRALVEGLCARAGADGDVAAIYLHVATANEAARALYRGAGFRELPNGGEGDRGRVATEEAAVSSSNPELDEVLMCWRAPVRDCVGLGNRWPGPRIPSPPAPSPA